MAQFPGSLPTNYDSVGSETLATQAGIGHAALHDLHIGELIAIATKIGTGAFTPSSGTVLRGTGAGTSAWGQVNLTTDVTGTLPVTKGGTGGATASDARTSLGVNTALETLALAYPVGSVYINANVSTNPATLLGFGTWSAFGEGRVLVGAGASDQTFNAGDTGGASSHTLVTDELPAHAHTMDTIFSFTQTDGAANEDPAAVRVGANSNRYAAQVQGGGTSTGDTGSGTAHNNLQPYITVYMWRRTA